MTDEVCVQQEESKCFDSSRQGMHKRLTWLFRQQTLFPDEDDRRSTSRVLIREEEASFERLKIKVYDVSGCQSLHKRFLHKMRVKFGREMRINKEK